MTELLEIPTSEIKIDGNIGYNRKADDELVGSMRKYGVLSPLLAWRGEDGFHLIYGHRRLDAAKQIRLEYVPVVVIDAPDNAKRLALQAIENLTRQDMSPLEVAETYQALLFELEDEDAVAALVARPVHEVRMGRQVAEMVKDEPVREEVKSLDLTLMQSAALAEIKAADKPGSVHEGLYERLVSDITQRPDQVEHHISQAKTRLDRYQPLEEKRLKLLEAGYKQIDLSNTFCPQLETSQEEILTYLVDEDGERLTPDGHADCPGRAFTLQLYNNSIVMACADWKEYGHKHSLTANKASAESAERKAKAEKESKIRAQEALERESATAVRRKFLRERVFSTQPRRGWQQVITSFLLAGNNLPAPYDEKDIEFWRSLLGITAEDIEAWACHDENRASLFLLVSWAAASEKHLSNSYWWDLNYNGEQDRFKAYFEQLVEWGYRLSYVEQCVVDGKTDPEHFLREAEKKASEEVTKEDTEAKASEEDAGAEEASENEDF